MKSAPLLVRATLQGSGGDPSEGRLTFIDNGVDAATGTIKLKATFANGATQLWPGQFLDVVLRLAEKPGSVVVPAAALQNGQMGQYVFVVRQDDTVELRQVTAGPKIGDEIPIEAGIEAGERVVTEGQLRLAAGSKVKVLT